MVPPELVNPVTDIEEIIRLTGYILKADQQPVPIAQFLSDLVGVMSCEYRYLLLSWMTEHRKLTVVWNWLGRNGSIWLAYLDHLQQDASPDGLEFLEVCMATHFHMNLIQQGHFWSTRVDSPVNSDPTAMLVEDGLLFCDWFTNGTAPKQEPLELVNLSAGDSDSDASDKHDLSDDSLSDLYSEKAAPSRAARTCE